MDKFHDITSIFPLKADEKIKDVDGGHNSIVIVTDKGNLYATGTFFWDAIDSSVRSND